MVSADIHRWFTSDGKTIRTADPVSYALMMQRMAQEFQRLEAAAAVQLADGHPDWRARAPAVAGDSGSG